MNAQEDIKILLIKRRMSLKKLAQEMSEITGKKMLLSSLSQKLSKGTLRYNELKIICDLLNFEIQYLDKL